MKQSALDYMKTNIGSLYKNYYQFDSPEWIYDLFDYDPFELFDTVEDFELISLDQQSGEAELQNCKILYTKLKNLTDSQASDERLWAGLTNKTFYTFMRNRWKYARKHLKKTADDSLAIKSRYYYRNAGRSGMFRNTLARCWWVGRLTYSAKYNNHWELLDAIGSEDLISKISDIFFSYTFSDTNDILEGFCQGLKFFRDRNIHVATREHIRPTVQYLNALGGGVLLDMLKPEEIKNLVIEHMGLLIKGVDPGIIAEMYDDTDDILEENNSNEEEYDAEEVNVDFSEYLEILDQEEELDIDSVLGELTEVEYGCNIHIRKMPQNTFFISRMPMADGELNELQRWCLGKPVGAKWSYARSTYEIFAIRR